MDLRPLTDGDNKTFWASGEMQIPGDAIELDLGHVVAPCSIQLSLGGFIAFSPRRLSVTISTDRETWGTVFDEPMGGAAVLAGIDRPDDPRLEIPLHGMAARFVQLRLEEIDPMFPWVVTDLAVIGGAGQ